VRNRGQLLVAVVVAAVVVAAAVYLDREVGARPLAAPPPGQAPSGAWFCPHGGGTDWEAWIELANPGTQPVLARIRGLSGARAPETQDLEVAPGSTIEVAVPSDAREASTTVEYFGGFVAAGWLLHAAGEESGVAAEPCLAETSTRWFLPDGTTLEEGNDDYVVVMNPYATDATISLTLLTERREPIRTEDWTNVALKPFHSQAFRLNRKALGETTVSTLLEVSGGRVAAATLGVTRTGGIRSAVGVPATSTSRVLPGGADAGRSGLIVMNAGLERVGLSGAIVDPEGEQPIAGLADASPPGGSARTIPATTATPSSMLVEAEGPGIAFARRTYGVATDQASTTGAARAEGVWIVLPAVAGAPSHPGIVLTNPGTEATTVTLSVLPAAGVSPPAPITLEVPPRSAVNVPKAFVESSGASAVLATAEGGTFVPATASYSRGREGYATYAVAVGVPIPDAWVPSAP
jgi:hypothetical protein